MTTTTSPPPLSPSRRGKVAWSQHTSYPGAAGLHSEVGPTARSVQITGGRELHASVSGMQSLHHKELRRLQRQRKNLQASMLAYAHKMRDISSGKLLVNSPVSSSSSGQVQSEGVSTHRNGGKTSPRDPGTVDSGGRSTHRKGTRSSDSDKNQTGTHYGQNDNDKMFTRNGRKDSDDTGTKIRSRISVDSGIDVTEAWVEEGSKAGRQRVSLPALNTASPDPVRKPRPASFHTAEKNRLSEEPRQTERVVADPRPSSFHTAETSEEAVRGLGPNTPTAFTASSKTRQRRIGTNQSPDILFQKFSAQNNQLDAENTDPDNLEFLLSLPHAEDVLPSISPFPEFSDEYRVDEDTGMTGFLTGRRNPTQIPSPLPLSPAKLKKMKEQYLNLKRTQVERKSPARNSNNLGKFRQLPLSSLSPRKSSFRKAKDKAAPSKVSFQQSFRYSEAVESVMKSFEDCKLEMFDQVHIRRAADFLPTLDLEDMKEERNRLKQQKRNTPKHTRKSSGSVFSSTQNYDDITNDAKEDREARDDEDSDVRSDYGSDDGSVASFVSSQGHTSEEGTEDSSSGGKGGGYEGGSDTGGHSHTGREDRGDGVNGVSVPKTARVSFSLPALLEN